jgi:hypothetical protein
VAMRPGPSRRGRFGGDARVGLRRMSDEALGPAWSQEDLAVDDPTCNAAVIS